MPGPSIRHSGAWMRNWQERSSGRDFTRGADHAATGERAADAAEQRQNPENQEESPAKDAGEVYKATT